MSSSRSALSPIGGTDPGVAIRGAIEPTRLSTAYRLGLVVLTLVMLILPAMYVSLMVLAAMAVWWHLTLNTWILDAGSAGVWRALAYLGPALAGIVLVFFMVKPVLARPARQKDDLAISRADQPVLFDFIDRICGQVRAPVPTRVHVDCQVNASASLLPGPMGLFRRQLVLCIGLPLAAGLSTREFGGVLAHEFGHFAQGGGMRLTSIVRAINAWFARVVYERDEWDEKLDRWMKDADWRISLVLVMARVSIWVSRRVLAVLMIVGHTISCFMLRQMEYDADSYEIKFAGSAAFVRTQTRIRELGVCGAVATHALQQAWLNRTLPSDLPAFLIEFARSGRVPQETLDQVRAMAERPTGLFDTHPSDADRVRAAEAAGAPGVLVGGDEPATELFRDFDRLCEAATRHHYENGLGLNLEAATLVASDMLMGDQRALEEGWQALQSFFGECLSACRLLAIPARAVQDGDATAIRSAWLEARDTMERERSLAEKYRRFESLDATRTRTFCAQELLGAGFDSVPAGSFDLTEGTAEEAVAAERRAIEQQRDLEPELARFEAAAGRRLACAIELLRVTPDVRPAGASDSDTRWQEALSLAGIINAVTSVGEHLGELRRLALAETLLEQNRTETIYTEQMEGRLAQLGRRIASRREAVRKGLDDLVLPQRVTTSPTTAAVWCGLSPAGTPATSQEVFDRVINLYWRSLGALVVIALEVEQQLSSETLAT